jgi:hypothetical protein
MSTAPRRPSLRAPHAAVALGVALAAVAPAHAATVLVLSSGNAAVDQAVVSRLTSAGHNVVLGPEYTAFAGAGLTGRQVVYLQPNSNWAAGDMPAAGQSALLNFVNAGGGLVTCEWTTWKVAGLQHLQALAPALPAQPTTTYGGALSAAFNVLAADPTLDRSVPASFTTPLDSFGGTDTLFNAKPGATTYFSCNDHDGVVGWSYGGGRVLQFSTTNGQAQVGDTNFGRLFANAFDWAAGTVTCRADFTGDGAVNLQDFLSYLQAFAAGEARADFDQNGQVNIQDFLAFLQAFAAGC